MHQRRRYVPILLGKRGEYAALNQMSGSARNLVEPIIEVPLMSEFKRQPVTLDRHIEQQVQRLGKYWGPSGTIGVDLRAIDPRLQMVGGVHPLDALIEQAREQEVTLIPVTGLRRHSTYQAAVRFNAQRSGGDGLVLRVEAKDLRPETIESSIDRFLSAAGTDPALIDLVLDLGAISPISPSRAERRTVAGLQMLPRRDEWRSVALAASSFPKMVPRMGKHPWIVLPRSEWKIWRAVVAGAGEGRIPDYGDYGASHPVQQDFDPKKATIPVALRYTTEDKFLVRKAGARKKVGDEAFRSIARWIVEREEYGGAELSWGDEWLAQCAAGAGMPGTPEVWRKVSTSHHLALITKLLRAG